MLLIINELQKSLKYMSLQGFVTYRIKYIWHAVEFIYSIYIYIYIYLCVCVCVINVVVMAVIYSSVAP